MKKEVQALINRRRARLVPAVLAGVAGLILCVGVWLVFSFFRSPTGQALVRSPTPTPTVTFTPVPPTPTSPPTETPLFPDTPTVTPGPSPTPTPITYTVQDGDTLFGIAVQFQVDLQALKLVNNLTSDALSVGQVLIIPSDEVQTSTPSPLPSNLPRGAKIQYTVLLGDTLELIASQFNSTVEDISQQNNGLTNDNLQSGQVITVRVNLVTPTPTVVASNTPEPATVTLTSTP